MKNLFLCFLVWSTPLISQTIGTFNSVIPTAQTENLVLPLTHRFQKLMQTGDALTGGGVLKGTPDFTCYVPITGSSTNGYVSLNHEEGPGAVSIMDVNYNAMTKLWNITNAQAADLTAINGYTAANCSGGLTPWGTVLSGEEAVLATDFNSDGYNDIGWFIEVNPVTRQVTRKLWALGCMQHENAAVASDGTKIYFGADNATNGYVYKFVCATANDPTSGTLSVLKLTNGGNGDWVVIPNTTQADRNNTLPLSAAAQATNIVGVEDVEIGPDGKIYVTSKYDQQVYRFTDNGTTVSNYETYVSNQCYTINSVCEPYGYSGQNGNDNLAFDGEGNLWILQDGGRNHIWVVGPTHVPSGTNDVRLFATTPAGSEPTGITFTPDYKFIFISIQHPNGTNAASQTDATGNALVFNKGTTLVIARQEFLGTQPLPIELQSFTGQIINKNQVELKWQIQDKQFLEFMTIERSVDGVKFDKIGEKRTPPDYLGTSPYFDHFTDENPVLSKNYYRLVFTEKDGTQTFSKIIAIAFDDNLPKIKVALNPFTEETIVRYSNLNKNAKALIYNALGALVLSKNVENTDLSRDNREGVFFIGNELTAGIYFLKIDSSPSIGAIKLVKTH
jgi:uncharacterized protein